MNHYFYFPFLTILFFFDTWPAPKSCQKLPTNTLKKHQIMLKNLNIEK